MKIGIQYFEIRRFVFGQGVVHVESVELDLLQVKAPVDENP